jgi:hypothetical protein
MLRSLTDAKCLKRFGWGTWIRTRTNGVRVRGSTVNLFPIAEEARAPSKRRVHACEDRSGKAVCRRFEAAL